MISKMMQRDDTFDVMKGFGILAMVIGHCHIPNIITKFIFVWHMPLFFVVSGYFYKQKPDEEYLKKNARQLLLPYIATSIAMIFVSGLRQLVVGKGDTLTMVIAALVGNGSKNNPTFSEYSIGAIWFLLAMFWCRLFYNNIQIRRSDPRIVGGIILTTSVIATYIGSKVYVPMDILEGLEALLFFHIGHLMRQYKFQEMRINGWCVTVVVLLVILSVYSGSMSMVRCYYGYWPINYLAAVGLITLIFHTSKYLRKNRFLVWCGRASMVILCVHIVELTFLPYKIIGIPKNIDVLPHLLVTLFGSWMLLKFNLVKKLFQYKY